MKHASGYVCPSFVFVKTEVRIAIWGFYCFSADIPLSLPPPQRKPVILVSAWVRQTTWESTHPQCWLKSQVWSFKTCITTRIQKVTLWGRLLPWIENEHLTMQRFGYTLTSFLLNNTANRHVSPLNCVIETENTVLFCGCGLAVRAVFVT